MNKVVRAYIMVECEVGQIAEVVRGLRKLEGVAQADATLGPCDVMVLTEKPDLDALASFITEQVQAVPGVKGTTTCLSIQL